MSKSRLLDAFSNGVLLDPQERTGNAVDLIRAVARHYGVNGIAETETIASFRDEVGEANHTILILVDGLGMNLVERMEPAGFFRTTLSRELRALAPSTTSCVLTSLATGVYPAEHAITGWYTHLPEFGRTVLPLPWVDRGTGTGLGKLGIEPEQVFPLSPLMPRMKTSTLCLLPADYWDSPYARYWRGGEAGAGYKTISGAVDRLLAHVGGKHGRTFSYFYIPDVDTVSHETGPGSVESMTTARMVEAELGKLASRLPTDARLLITADHGQIHVPLEGRCPLFDGDELLELLVVPPTGEARMPFFHVKPGRTEAFVALFSERYAERFLLLRMEDVENLGIFGPPPFTPAAKRRFGDFAAFPKGKDVLHYYPPGETPESDHPGRHGGLSADEMRVPLMVT